MKGSYSLEHIKHIAIELGLTKQQVEEVVKAPFEYQYYVQTKLVDRDNDIYPSVRIPSFGMFYKNQGRISFVKSRLKKKKDKENELINVQ